MLPRRHKNSGRARERRSFPEHLAWVRGFVCAAWHAECCDGRIQAHHVREHHDGGESLTPSDYLVVPLCAIHHAELHTIGAKTFEAKYAVDLSREAAKLASASPHRHKWEAGE